MEQPSSLGERAASPAASTASSGSWEGALDGAALRRLAASRHEPGTPTAPDHTRYAEDIDGVPGLFNGFVV